MLADAPSAGVASLGEMELQRLLEDVSTALRERARAHPSVGGGSVPVVDAADLIGLKVQSSSNDPRRRLAEMRHDALANDAFRREMRDSAAAVARWERQHPATLANALDFIRRLGLTFTGSRPSDEPTRGDTFPLL